MCKILFIIVITVLAGTTAIAAAAVQPRIIGGAVADIAKYPYLVSIRSKVNANSAYWHKCAGSIYTERVIITAAQCFDELNGNERVIVVAGANSRTGADGMIYLAAKWIAHPSYSFWTADYDVGIIILEDAFDLQHFGIRTIKIREQRPAVGKLGSVAGWGYREEFGPSSSHLLETEVPIVSIADCQKAYQHDEVTERMICAGYLVSGGKDACQGDTGGPLVVENELIGLVSWGYGCARPGYPGVYTYVLSLKNWIDETIAANL